MKTFRICIVPILVAAGLFQQGCGTTEVAKAQQVVHAANVDFHAFVTFEKEHRDQLWAINHNIKHTADKLRHRSCETCDPDGVKWLNSAIAMVDAYKNNRSPENKANMDTALAVIQELITQISEYFMNPQVSSLDTAVAYKYRNAKVVP